MIFDILISLVATLHVGIVYIRSLNQTPKTTSYKQLITVGYVLTLAFLFLAMLCGYNDAKLTYTLFVAVLIIADTHRIFKEWKSIKQMDIFFVLLGFLLGTLILLANTYSYQFVSR